MEKQKDVLFERGKEYYQEGDYESAYNYFLEAILQNHGSKALVYLGIMYLWGIYPRKDWDKAFQYFKDYYVETKDTLVLPTLMDFMDDNYKSKHAVKLYMDFLDFLIEHEVWQTYITKALEYGDKDGIHKYVPTDYQMKENLLKEAVKHGVDYGYSCLGEMYFLGELDSIYGEENKYKNAYEYFVKGPQNQTMPLYYLGEMYKDGLYVKKDIDKAIEYYKAVTNVNHPMIKEDLHYNMATERLQELENC